MKKILYITTISGFLPQFEMHNVATIQSMGYEVHYASNFDNPIYSFNKEYIESNGIICHNIPIQKSPKRLKENYKAISDVKKLIDKEEIDIVHCHNPMGGVAGRLAAKLSKKKPYVIYTAHGFHFYKRAPLKNWIFFYPAEKMLARLTDVIVTINEEDFERANRKFKLKKNGYVEQIKGAGVDSNKFKPNPQIRERIRESLNIPKDAFHIVTAAELNDNKNQRVIIEAIDKLVYRDIYYTLCGKGPREEDLKALIDQKGLSNRIRLVGFRKDMDEVLQSADAFAFPSIREGLGIAAVEALLCGVPLIALDNRGTREYARHGINGLVCKDNNEIEFAIAIEELYTDKEYRDFLAKASRLSAQQFAVEETKKIIQRIYEKVNLKVE